MQFLEGGKIIKILRLRGQAEMNFKAWNSKKNKRKKKEEAMS